MAAFTVQNTTVSQFWGHVDTKGLLLDKLFFVVQCHLKLSQSILRCTLQLRIHNWPKERLKLFLIGAP